MRDCRHVADPFLGALGRPLHPGGEALVHQGERREDHRPDESQERIGRDHRDQREHGEREHPEGERHRPVEVHRRFHVGLHVREQLSGRRLPVVGEGQFPVAVGDLRPERRHHALAPDPAEEPADHDPERTERSAEHQQQHGDPDLRRRHAAPERRLQDLVGGSADLGGEPDRCEREQQRPRERHQERLRVHADVRGHQAHPAPEQAPRVLDLRLLHHGPL